MTNRIFPLAATLLFTSTAAMAEITPQDVLENWRAYYATYGASISIGSPVQTGRTTRFPDVVVETGRAGGTTLYKLDYMDMRSNADGSVDVTFSPEASATTSMAINGEQLTGEASFDLGSLRVHVEGMPQDMAYSYSAPVITYSQSQAQPGLDLTFTMALGNLEGSTHARREGPLVTQAGAVTADSVSALITAQPTGKPPVYIDYQSENMHAEYDNSAERATTPQSAIFPESMVMGMTLTTGPSTTTVDQKTATGSARFTLTQAGGEMTFAFAEGALSYGLTATGADMVLANTPARAVDFSAALNRFHIGATYPMRAADTPLPFALSLAIKDLTVADDVWNKIDPEATLSRAPASFDLSLNGTVVLRVDLFDQEAITALRGRPFELRSLSLMALNLDFEGMGLTGEGGVTFNNQRQDSNAGLPEPTGRLDFALNGALGLLDKIGRLGLGDPMMVIGAKGALGMFATAGNGPDSFTSRIEFTEGGHISVNGQRVK
jgi:hypothetical protein